VNVSVSYAFCIDACLYLQYRLLHYMYFHVIQPVLGWQILDLRQQGLVCQKASPSVAILWICAWIWDSISRTWDSWQDEGIGGSAG